MSKHVHRVFGADELLDMAARVRAGQGATEICRAYGTTATMLYRALEAAGIPRPTAIGVARTATMRQMRADGATLPDIAAALGCSAWTAYDYLKREGIKAPKGAKRDVEAVTLDRDRKPRHVAKQRACMACRKPFTSKWAGNRRCAPCLAASSAQDGPYAL